MLERIGDAMTQQAAATQALLARATRDADADVEDNADAAVPSGARGTKAMQQDRSRRSTAPGKLAMDIRELARQQITSDPMCPDARAKSMLAYFERCGGYGGAKSMSYLTTGLATIADLMLMEKWREAEDLVLALCLAADQALLNDNKWYYAWQVTHLPEPLEHVVSRKPNKDSFRPYSRLMPATLMAAVTAYSAENSRTMEQMKKI